jgi:hypothetical protein
MRAFVYAAGFIAGAFSLWLLTLCLSILAGAVELHISGSSSGTGLQNLSFVGDALNVSLLQNGTGWNITAVTP